MDDELAQLKAMVVAMRVLLVDALANDENLEVYRALVKAYLANCGPDLDHQRLGCELERILADIETASTLRARPGLH